MQKQSQASYKPLAFAKVVALCSVSTFALAQAEKKSQAHYAKK